MDNRIEKKGYHEAMEAAVVENQQLIYSVQIAMEEIQKQTIN